MAARKEMFVTAWKDFVVRVRAPVRCEAAAAKARYLLQVPLLQVRVSCTIEHGELDSESTSKNGRKVPAEN